LRLKIRNLESENNKLKTRSNSYINVINQQTMKYRTLQEENVKKLEEVKNNYDKEVCILILIIIKLMTFINYYYYYYYNII